MHGCLLFHEAFNQIQIISTIGLYLMNKHSVEPYLKKLKQSQILDEYYPFGAYKSKGWI